MTPNICAGPFGALYDFYIERPRLMQAIGFAMWGMNASVLYEKMLARARRRVANHSLSQIEVAPADMTALPVAAPTPFL